MWFGKPTIEVPGIGALSFSKGAWQSNSIHTNAGDVLVALEGDATSPNSGAIALAKEVLENARAFVQPAIEFASSDSRTQEFIEGNGELVLDGFTISAAPPSVRVELSLSEWPDAMITVVFRGRTPCEILLAD